MTSFSKLGQSYSGLSGKLADDFGIGKPYITYLNVYSNNVVNENDYQYVRISDGEKQNVVKYGDVLFTLSSETPEEVGVGSVYLGKDDVYLNSFCFGIHIENKGLAYSPYLSYYVSSTPFRKFIYPFAQGSTRFNLCKADFEKADIKLPSLDNQKHIYAILNHITEKIETEKMILERYTIQNSIYFVRCSYKHLRSKYCFSKFRLFRISCSVESLSSIVNNNVAYLSCSEYCGQNILALP